MFHVGQKVVCVDDQWPGCAWYGPERLPVKGQVYTVRELCDFDDEMGPTVRLCEIVNPELDYEQGVCEAVFSVRRFRPVRETSIECFRAYLAPLPNDLVPA